jgi:hypothetical protein
VDSLKLAAVIAFCRRFVAPAAIGGLVLWLIANDLSAWVPAVCGVADALAIAVTECSNGSV